MRSQDNDINLLKQLPCHGKTIKPIIKKFTNLRWLSELPFFEKSIKTRTKQLSTKKYYKNNLFINSL